MIAVNKYARQGRPVVRICYGFQDLLVAVLLAGANLHNKNLRYICKDVYIRVENNSSLFTSGLSQGTVLKMPVSHGEGNYYIDDEGLRSLEENNQIAFRY